MLSPKSTHARYGCEDVDEKDLRKSTVVSNTSSYATRAFSRARVLNFYEQAYPTKRGSAIEKVLVLDVIQGPLPSRTSSCTLNQSMYFQESLHHAPPVRCYARLRDEWQSLAVRPDDMVHLIGEWDAEGDVPIMTLATFVADTSRESQRLLILHPDVIISASRLASVASCMRKSMLQERIRSPTESTYVAVMGTAVHGLLQACLVASVDPVSESKMPTAGVQAPKAWDRLGNFSQAFLAAEVERQLELVQEALVLVHVATETARTDLYAAIPSLVRFAETYLAFRDGRVSSMAVVQDPRTDTHVSMRFTRVVGIELDITCPMYGLKGRMDVCMEAEILSEAGLQRALLPIEIKTGRVTSSMEHMAQTSLYTMLLADAYGMHVDCGLLLYIQNCEMRRVHRVVREVRSLIMARNDMASYKVQKALLPSPTSLSVDVVHESTTQTEPPSSPDSFEFELTEADLEDVVCDIRPPILPPTIDSRFKCQRCYSRDACMLYRRALERVTDIDSPIADLYTESTSHLTPQDLSFFADWDALLSHEERSLQRHQAELWTMSAEARQAAGRCLSHVSMRQCTDSACTFDVLSEHVPFVAEDLVILAVQTPVTAFLSRARVLPGMHLCVRFESSMDMALSQYKAQYGNPQTFRIDLDDIMSMMGVPRYNLACLFYKDVPPQVEALRRRVVHLDAPQWTGMDDRMRTCMKRHTMHCNEDQCRAIERALCARDYALILGMPGTGKSSTIAMLVRILVELGQRVLLCSHTHSAVDTIVSKLLDAPVLRLGPLSRVHPRVHACTLTARLGTCATSEEVVQVVAEAQVVAATCLGSSDAVLARRAFDVCIIDEASQITVPTCLGPLRLADRFVMIGDHHQLTPLVRDTDAAQHGMSVSLFQRLCKAHPSSVAMLCTQYRMNADIMALSNALVYDGRLVCGNESVACAKFTMKRDACPSWLWDVLDPARPAVFVDTDAVKAVESRADTLVENRAEAEWIVRMSDMLIQANVAAADIGILTPYRQQAKLLRDRCACEVLTVDQAQGRDWPVVLVSLVRSNKTHTVGELLRDQRRVNVMITRAKTKLVLVGSYSTMIHGPCTEPMPALLPLLRIIQPKEPADIPVHVSPGRQRYVKKARRPTPVVTDLLNEQDCIAE